jgi:hypothetical protein
VQNKVLAAYVVADHVGWWDVPVPTYLTERRARHERERAEEQGTSAWARKIWYL